MNDERFEVELSQLLRARAEHPVDRFSPRDVANDAINNAPEQHGPVSGLRRTLQMTTRFPHAARYGLVAAAVVGAFVLGTNMVEQTDPGASSTPVASDAVTVSADPQPLPEFVGEGPVPPTLPAGRYSLPDPFPLEVSFDLPSGWAVFLAGDDHMGVWVPGRPDQRGVVGPARYIQFAIVDGVFANPCEREAGLESPVGSVDALVGTLANLAGFAASDPESIEIAGLPARGIVLTPTSDLDACRGEALLWVTPSGEEWILPTSDGENLTPLQIRGLNVDGALLTVIAVNFGGSMAGEDELAQIIGSIEIER